MSGEAPSVMVKKIFRFLCVAILCCIPSNGLCADDLPCVENVCVGQSLETITVSWESMDNAAQLEKSRERVLSAFPKANPKQLEKIAARLSIYENAIYIDTAVINSLKDVAPVCREFLAYATFLSPSGYETLVVFKPTSSDERIGQWRVYEIERRWRLSRDESDGLGRLLKDRYGALGYHANSPRSFTYDSVGNFATLRLRKDGTLPRENLDERARQNKELMYSKSCGINVQID